MTLLDPVAALFAVAMLGKHGRRALLFVAPGFVRLEPAEDAVAMTAGELRAKEALEGMGFTRLGRLRVRGPARGLFGDAETYGHTGSRAYADIGTPGGGRGAEVRFTTAFPRGVVVATSTDGSPIEAAWVAHEAAVARFARTQGEPLACDGLEGRLLAVRAWYQGEGRRELRRRFVMNFLSALAALVLLAGSVNLLLRGLKS